MDQGSAKSKSKTMAVIGFSNNWRLRLIIGGIIGAYLYIIFYVNVTCAIYKYLDDLTYNFTDLIMLLNQKFNCLTPVKA